MRTRFALRLAAVALLFAVAAAPVFAADPDPAKVVSPADVAAALGGKWKSEVPEPGVIFYNEDGGAYRSVQVYLFEANGKTVSGMKAQWEQEGEPVEMVNGGATIYRPQRREAAMEKKDAAGHDWWLAVSVQGGDEAAAKKGAGELVKRGAAKL